MRPRPVAPGETGGITEVLPFDTTKYVLGKLCPRGHAWGSTGQCCSGHESALLRL